VTATENNLSVNSVKW